MKARSEIFDRFEMDEGALEMENHQQTEMKTMARTYRNTPETKQKTKRRKSKKNKLPGGLSENNTGTLRPWNRPNT